MDARAISSLPTVRIPVASAILIPMECVYKFVWQMVAGAEAHCESKLAAEILAEEAWFCVCTLGNQKSRHIFVWILLAMVNLFFCSKTE